MSKTTTITTDYSRELTVIDRGYNFNLAVKDTDGKYAALGEVYTSLEPAEATQLASALVGENATVITDLPEVTSDVDGWVFAGTYGAWETAKPETVLKKAKELLAIHAFLVKRNEEQEVAKAEAEAKAAEEAKAEARDKRRDELAYELLGYGCTYSNRTSCFLKAIDRIIDLEEAAKV